MSLKALFISVITAGYVFAGTQEEVVCHTLEGADAGTEAIIYSTLNDAGIHYTALVNTITIAGPRPLIQEPVTLVRSPLMGAPVKYVGQRIELTINWTTTPTEAGEHWGTLLVNPKGGKKISKHVLCSNVQN